MSDSRPSSDVAGTVRMLETDQASTEVILIPTPSLDPHDPLNWSRKRKHLQLACLTLYTMAAALSASSLFAIFVPLSEATGLTLDQLNSGTGYSYFPIGFGPLLLQPVALAFGKRPVYVCTAFILAGVVLWTPYATTYGQWIANRLLFGFFGSPSFAMVEVSISDVYFLHERGLPMGAYILFLYLGATLAPLLGGFIYAGMTWQAVLYFNGGFNGLVAIFCFFFLEETNFERPDSEPATIVEPQTTREAYPPELQHHDVPSLDEKKDLEHDSIPSHQTQVVDPSFALRHEIVTQDAETVKMTKPWLTFGKVSPYAGAVLLRGCLVPLSLLALPLIWWIGLMYGIYQIWFNTIGSLVSFTLSSPPYNFSTTAVGLAYISPSLGILPGAIFGGWVTDWHSIRLAKKANGIFEPEMRCQLLWLPSVTTPIGLLMMGLGPHYEAHWIVFVLGMGIVNVGGPFATMIILNYAFDCYHGMTPPSTNKAQAINHQSAPYIIASMVIAMSMAFGYGYAVTPWILGLGFKNFGITTAAVATAFNLSSIVIIKYGKWLRKRGQGYYQKMVAL